MPGRHESAADQYRYGFQGQEMDDEMEKGHGNSYDFGARILDPRIGRWLSRDPLEAEYTALSPYNFVANTPIIAIDPNGKDIIIAYRGKEKRKIKAELRKLKKSEIFKKLWKRLDNDHNIEVVIGGKALPMNSLGATEFSYHSYPHDKKGVPKLEFKSTGFDTDGQLIIESVQTGWIEEPSVTPATERKVEIGLGDELFETSKGKKINHLTVALSEELFHAGQLQLEIPSIEAANINKSSKEQSQSNMLNKEAEAKMLVLMSFKELYTLDEISVGVNDFFHIDLMRMNYMSSEEEFTENFTYNGNGYKSFCFEEGIFPSILSDFQLLGYGRIPGGGAESNNKYWKDETPILSNELTEDDKK